MHTSELEMPCLTECELPLGGTTGAGAACGSAGTAGLTAPFWRGGLADGVGGAATDQCKEGPAHQCR